MRNAITDPISFGCATRPSGVIAITRSNVVGSSFSSWRRARSVIVKLGTTAFTRIPNLANSRAKALVSAMTAPFEVAYAAVPSRAAAALTRHRAHVHDAAALLAQHQRNHGLAAKPGPRNVDAHHSFVFLQTDLEERP